MHALGALKRRGGQMTRQRKHCCMISPGLDDYRLAARRVGQEREVRANCMLWRRSNVYVVFICDDTKARTSANKRTSPTKKGE
jgi:hypothetical protein